MDEPLDESYLKWLYRHVASARLKNPARTYWSLIRQLYTKEFVWLVPNDDNRTEDGRDLRYEFIEETGVIPDAIWMEVGCSMLEMLIGLSRRLAFEAEGESRGWFWHLMENVGLRDFSDGYYYDNHNSNVVVKHILDQINLRTYDADGSGGLFPLKNPHQDQREVELWYQLSAYLGERL